MAKSTFASSDARTKPILNIPELYMLKFSIITVVFNNATQVEQCICSVLSQKYRNFEYIIIDGGSTDGTVELINKYRDQLAVVISEPDKGIADAFNKGLRIAKGEIIGFINSDDWLAPDCLQNVAAADNGSDILYGMLRQIRKNSITEIDADHSQLPKYMTLNHPATFVRGSTYQKWGSFNPEFSLAMDFEFLLRCYVAGASFTRIPHVLANMRLAGKSETHWLNAIREVKKAKYMHLGKSLKHQLYFLWQMALIPVSRITRHALLKPVKKWYTRKSAIKRSEVLQ